MNSEAPFCYIQQGHSASIRLIASDSELDFSESDKSFMFQMLLNETF